MQLVKQTYTVCLPDAHTYGTAITRLNQMRNSPSTNGVTFDYRVATLESIIPGSKPSNIDSDSPFQDSKQTIEQADVFVWIHHAGFINDKIRYVKKINPKAKHIGFGYLHSSREAKTLGDRLAFEVKKMEDNSNYQPPFISSFLNL